MQEYSLDIIGTHLSLQIDTEENVSSLFEQIRERLMYFEQKYSRFIRGNWLDTLNRERLSILDEDGKKMLEYALYVAKYTNGYFDPTVGSRLAELGYGIPTETSHRTGYEHIEIIGNQVILHEDILLEFGGVGKGYLIDVIYAMIVAFSPEKKTRFMIDFGGDIYASGDWIVGLENPHNFEEVIGTIHLDDRYLACSSGGRRRWAGHHHLIDPKTGVSASEVAATYIEGSSGIETDAFATALAVMPFLTACELLYNHTSLFGIILAKDGRVFHAPGSQSVLFT